MTRRISLVAFLLLALAGCHTHRSIRLDTREKVISTYTSTLKHWDKNADGRLSRSEVETVVNESFRRMAQSILAGEAHSELETQRQQTIGELMAQDTNGDGYLSLSEFVKEPLANFSCIDADHDGKLSKSEEHSAMDRCPPSPFGNQARSR